MLLLLIEGSIEQIVLNVGWGPRVLLAFFVSVVCFRAVLRDEGYLKKP
jgi:hypothetical protein